MHRLPGHHHTHAAAAADLDVEERIAQGQIEKVALPSHEALGCRPLLRRGLHATLAHHDGGRWTRPLLVDDGHLAVLDDARGQWTHSMAMRTRDIDNAVEFIIEQIAASDFQRLLEAHLLIYTDCCCLDCHNLPRIHQTHHRV